jgi:hypothetical protein
LRTERKLDTPLFSIPTKNTYAQKNRKETQTKQKKHQNPSVNKYESKKEKPVVQKGVLERVFIFFFFLHDIKFILFLSTSLSLALN